MVTIEKQGETHFPVQSVASACGPTKQLLADVAETFGRVPSILGVMANSPMAIESYQRLSILFSLSAFTPLEIHGIHLTIIRESGCVDLTFEHISLLNGWFNVPESVTQAIVSGKPTGKDKLDVLLKTVRQLMQNQGSLSSKSRKQFINAGYTKSQLIDLLVPVAMKTMTRYLENLNHKEVE